MLKFKKDTAVILDDRYKDPKTIPLIFRFEPISDPEIQSRMKNWTLQRVDIEGQDLYLIDGFFTQEEGHELREFSKSATFSRDIFSTADGMQKGQKPARSMNGKEKWDFFSNPPRPVLEFYKLLSQLSSQLNAEITTFPWDLFNGVVCSPAFATNLVRENSKESTERDKHKDVDLDKKGAAFGIPILYANEKAYHPNRFVNGSIGKPWLVTAMIYSTAENFLTEYGIGTVFYRNNGEMAFRAECIHMRIVLFESDIIHSIEHSNLPPGLSTERVSYVFKLTMNPRQHDHSVKNSFQACKQSFSTAAGP